MNGISIARVIFILRWTRNSLKNIEQTITGCKSKNYIESALYLHGFRFADNKQSVEQNGWNQLEEENPQRMIIPTTGETPTGIPQCEVKRIQIFTLFHYMNKSTNKCSTICRNENSLFHRNSLKARNCLNVYVYDSEIEQLQYAMSG